MELHDRLARWFETATAEREPLLILGPCVIESEPLLVEVAAAVAALGRERGLLCVLKASFDKANRTSLGSFRGPGLAEGLRLLGAARASSGLPVCTDIHEPAQAAAAAAVVDLLQVPAFLCRQTDLLLAAGRAGKPVNLKKGQQLAPEAMAHAVEKVRSTGNGRVLVTERGSCFGPRDLVVDFRGLPTLRRSAPVLFDATHSAQRPAAGAARSGGDWRDALLLARAAAAAGVDGFFFETHPDPARALCDGPNAVPLAELPAVVDAVLAIWRAARVSPGGARSEPA
jgi:2-dehydro-3-deoxyphosphooctonate aldolase (KDO 8-P synthase)